MVSSSSAPRIRVRTKRQRTIISASVVAGAGALFLALTAAYDVWSNESARLCPSSFTTGQLAKQTEPVFLPDQLPPHGEFFGIFESQHRSMENQAQLNTAMFVDLNAQETHIAETYQPNWKVCTEKAGSAACSSSSSEYGFPTDPSLDDFDDPNGSTIERPMGDYTVVISPMSSKAVSTEVTEFWESTPLTSDVCSLDYMQGR